MRAHVHQQLAGPLSDPGSGRVRGDAGQPHPAPVEFDDEQDVEPGQADRLDGEEVTGQHPAGLSAQELRPARSAAARGRSEPVPAQDVPDRGRGHGDAELGAFAGDPLVAPPRVLPGHAQHQIDDRRIQSAPTAVPVRVGPAAPDQVPVPAQQRGRRYQERRPPLPRQQPRQHRQHQPIRRGVPGPGDLPAQHRQLVPQDGDLHVLRIRRRTDPQQPEHPTQQHEPDTADHARGSCHAQHRPCSTA